MSSLKGQFLVASPHLADPNFFRSVVLMIQHDEEGALGVILNRRTTRTLCDVWDLISEEPCPSELPIQHGGPVQGPLTALHNDAAIPDNEIVPGLFFTADKDDLFEVVQKSGPSVLVFVGYAGWGSGQLEAELEAGGWLSTPATVDDVFGDPEDLWKRVVRRIGLDILAPSIKKDHLPDDPSMN